MLGYATGAVSIVSDGFHSLTDSASNIIGLVGLRASGKPPDEDHPYGHRKFETLAAGAIFVFLIIAVIEIGRAALNRIASPAPPEISWVSFAIMFATLAVNIWVVRYEEGEGRRLASELLLADAVHTRSDVFATIGVLIALTAVAFGYPLLDPIGGVMIAILIARTSYDIARDTSGILSDRVVIDEGRDPARGDGRAGRARLPSHPHARARWIMCSWICTSGSPPTRRCATRTGCRTS